MKKKIGIAVILTMVVLTGCRAESSDNSLKEISRILGTDVNGGEIITKADDHGGFHGDGSTVVEIQFEGTSFAEQIEDNEDWNALPLTDNLTALVYGLHTENSSLGPMIHGGDNTPVIPAVENGYYLFMDRHSQSTDSRDDSKVLDRASYNFTIAIYDSDTQMLYYLELDT